jgi:hypothetical protein
MTSKCKEEMPQRASGIQRYKQNLNWDK